MVAQRGSPPPIPRFLKMPSGLPFSSCCLRDSSHNVDSRFVKSSRQRRPIAAGGERGYPPRPSGKKPRADRAGGATPGEMLSTPPSRPTAAGAPLPRWVGGPAARAPTARAGWRATSGSRPTTSGMSSTTASPRRGIPRARPRDFSTPSRAAPGATRPRCSAQPPAFASTASSAGKSSAFAARRTPPPLPHPSPSPSPEGEGINAPPPTATGKGAPGAVPSSPQSPHYVDIIPLFL